MNKYISLYIPKGKEGMRDFVRKEISECANIQSKQTRNTIERGLRKILQAMPDISLGTFYLTDGDELNVGSYDGIRQIYHCGKEYIHIKEQEAYNTMVVVMDANEATIGEVNGEKIRILWYDTSLVPRKHGKGGQSQQRFERGRGQALLHWMRDVAKQTIDNYHHTNLIIAGPGMTKDKFIEELPS